MRLDKLLRERGIATRRQVRALTAAGRVTVNGLPAESYCMEVTASDTVVVDGVTVEQTAPVYLLLHKPVGCVTATRDDSEQTVLDLLGPPYDSMALFPVGRLDKASEGMLLLTNDGKFCARVIDPVHHVEKTYYIEVGRPFSPDTEERFARGITFPDGTQCRPAGILVSPDRMSAYVTITEGKTHQVRRMSMACGSRVSRLKRISIGGLTMEDTLLPGQYRELTEEEVNLIFA